MTRGIGDNSAAYGEELDQEFDFAAFFDLIVEGSASAHEKLLKLVIARLSQKGGGKAAPKRSDILHQASCSEATFKRTHSLLKAFFEITPRRGATTEYALKPSVTADQVEDAVTAFRSETKGHGDTGSSRGGGHRDTNFNRTKGHKARFSVIPGSKSEGLSDTDFSKSEGHGDTGLKEKAPHTPQKENNINNNHPTTEAAREGGGLNGSAAVIVEKLAGWINPMMPDRRTAQGALENLIKYYTAPVVRDSFAELEAKILHGDIIARPIPYLTKVCQRRLSEQTDAKYTAGPPREGIYEGKFYLDGRAVPEPVFWRNLPPERKAYWQRQVQHA